MTNEERLLSLEKRTKKLEIVATLHTLALILGTIGVTTVLVNEIKKLIKK
jgi:hypothetical protein